MNRITYNTLKGHDLTWLSRHFYLIGSMESIYRSAISTQVIWSSSEVMATGEPEVNLSHPNAISPIDPRVPRIVHPMGEFGQESYIDLGYASPAKYPKVSEIQAKKHQ